MRITVDYTSAIIEPAGIGRYTRGLVRALAPLALEDTLTLFTSEAPPERYPLPSAEQARLVVRRIGHRSLTRVWHRLHIPVPAELLMGPADVIHGPDFVLPPAIFARRVVTIHDLAYLRYPEFAQPGITAFLSTEVPRALRAADHIIAVSETTASDLIQRLAVSRERISVIYPGVDSIFTHPAGDPSLQETRRLFQLAEPFILAVGTIEPRKNYEALIRAFAEASRQPDGPRLLVFAGRRGWDSDSILNAGSRFQAAGKIRFLGYVPDDKLAVLYQAATALAMPSHYEGFGVPLVEAMASGTPVIASTGGSLPEIAGDAALLVAPEDIDGLKDALLQISGDADLRARLIAHGRARSQLFTWEAAARAHLRIYHEAVRRR